MAQVEDANRAFCQLERVSPHLATREEIHTIAGLVTSLVEKRRTNPVGKNL